MIGGLLVLIGVGPGHFALQPPRDDEGALKERFSVTLNLPEQRVVLFSRTEDAIYFHLTGMHLRREKSAVNRREGGASLWTAPEAATDFARQMTYWAGRSTT